MDRRTFFKGAAAALGVAPVAAVGAVPSLAIGGGLPILIVLQENLPPAKELADGLLAYLSPGAPQATTVGLQGEALQDPAAIASLLDQHSGRAIFGVMDDASAILFQQVAATRGALHCAWAHHRIAGPMSRHNCTAAEFPSSLLWSEPTTPVSPHLGRFYGAVLGGGLCEKPSVQTADSPCVADSPESASVRDASLVSFVIKT